MTLSRYSSLIEVGCDEAGRGSLCGPVIAAAVILKKDFYNEDLNDSKKISLNKRNELAKIIHEEAIACEVGIVNASEIDNINILNASIKAMHNALDKIKIPFEIILVDGPHFKKYKKSKHECIIRGDSKNLAIAAASIIAKTYRDNLMLELHEKHPKYKWCRNKGYPTVEHRDAIKKYGINKYHRKSFKLLNNQTTLNI